MAPWESKLFEELNTIIHLNITKLSRIIGILNQESQQKWIDTLKEEVHETCTLLVEEATFFVAVHYLRKSCSKLCQLLQIKMIQYDSEKLTLYEEKKLLENCLKRFEEEIKIKQNKLKEMTVRQVELCRLLEKVPMVFVEKAIPTNTELENLSSEIKDLETEWQELQEKFNDIKLKIINLLQKLNLKLCPEIQRIISPHNDSSPVITKDNLHRISVYYEDLQQKQNLEKNKQLESLGKIMNDLYNSCHVAGSERKIKNVYNSTEDVIQMEITKLKSYRKDNEKTFSLYETYHQQWMRLSKFVKDSQRSNSVNRNMEQIMSLCKQVRQFEIQLINQVVEFEEKNREPFTTFGRTVPETIAHLHDTLGKHMINKISDRRTLSELIYARKEKQYITAEREIIRQGLHEKNVESELCFEEEITNQGSHERNMDSELTSDEDQISDDCNVEDYSLLIQKKVEVEEPLEVPPEKVSKIQEQTNETRLKSLSLPSNSGDLNPGENTNVNNREVPLAVNIIFNTNVSSNTTFKIKKSKTYTKCRAGKKIPYKPLPKKNQGASTSLSANLFRPKAVELIQGLFKGLDIE